MYRKLTHLRQQYKHIVNKQGLAQLLFRLQLPISAILRCYLRTCLTPSVVSYQCHEN